MGKDNTMEQTRNRLNPLVAGASVAVILASAVGVAAVTGLLPGSNAQKSDQPPAAQQNTAQPAANRPAAQHTGQAPAQRQHVASAATTSKACLDCAVVVAVNEVEVKGQGSGIGAVAGGVAGAVIGNQFGHGTGNTVMTVAGAAGGALAGNEIEKHARTQKRYDVQVRMDDQSVRTLQMQAMPTWRAGDRVRVVDGQIQPR